MSRAQLQGCNHTTYWATTGRKWGYKQANVGEKVNDLGLSHFCRKWTATKTNKEHSSVPRYNLICAGMRALSLGNTMVGQ